MKIGKIIKELRKKRGHTQEELCSKTFITQAYLSNVENGKRIPEIKTLKKISKALNISFSELMLLSIDEKDMTEENLEKLWKLKSDIYKSNVLI